MNPSVPAFQLLGTPREASNLHPEKVWSFRSFRGSSHRGPVGIKGIDWDYERIVGVLIGDYIDDFLDVLLTYNCVP